MTQFLLDPFFADFPTQSSDAESKKQYIADKNPGIFHTFVLLIITR